MWQIRRSVAPQRFLPTSCAVVAGCQYTAFRLFSKPNGARFLKLPQTPCMLVLCENTTFLACAEKSICRLCGFEWSLCWFNVCFFLRACLIFGEFCALRRDSCPPTLLLSTSSTGCCGRPSEQESRPAREVVCCPNGNPQFRCVLRQLCGVSVATRAVRCGGCQACSRLVLFVL